MTLSTPTRLRKLSYDLVGERPQGASTRHVVIGTADSFAETVGLVTKTTFLLDIRRAPINYARCFLVPKNGMVVPDAMLTTYRVCDSSDLSDGGDFLYGIGALKPCRGVLSKTSSYYALEADPGSVLWKCGRFFALLDPRESEAFFTLSDGICDGTLANAA